MADKHNSNIPSMGNVAKTDVTQMKENVEFHKDVFQNHLSSWSDTVSANIYPIKLADVDGDTSLYHNDSKWKFKCAGTDQIYIENGAIKPTTDNDVNLGSGVRQFKDIHIDGVAYIDEMDVAEYDIDGAQVATVPTNGVSSNGVNMIGSASAIVWFYLNTAPQSWKALATGGDTCLGVSGGAGDYNVNGGNADSSATWVVSGLTQYHRHAMALRCEDDTGGSTYKFGAGGYTNYASPAIASTGAWRAKASVGKLFQLDTA